MQHSTLKATTTVVDQELGRFEAIVSAWEVDRGGDTIARTAFDRTIEAWQQSGKNIPLLFEHSTEEIGHIDPFSMRATDAGLVAAGEVDRSTGHGQQVWRQIKRGTAGFSFGYMAKSTPRKGGKGSHLTEIDLLEITATSTPMHPATRVLGWKTTAATAIPTDAELRKPAAALGIEPRMSRRELRRRCDDLALEAALVGEAPPVTEPEAESVPTAADLRRESDRLRVELARDGIDTSAAVDESGPAVPTDAELRRKLAELGLAPPATPHQDRHYDRGQGPRRRYDRG